jgi:hypothetical protein
LFSPFGYGVITSPLSETAHAEPDGAKTTTLLFLFPSRTGLPREPNSSDFYRMIDRYP